MTGLRPSSTSDMRACPISGQPAAPGRPYARRSRGEEVGWTGSRNSTCTCSASSRPRGMARSWTSAGDANAPCWRGSPSRATRWCRPIGSSTASGATSRPPTRNGALQAYVSHLRRRLEPDATRPPAGRSHRPCRAGLRATPGTGRRRRVGVRGRGRVGGRAGAGGRGVHARDRVADVARTGVRRLRGRGVGRGGDRPAHRAARGRPRAPPRRRASSSARPSSSSATSRRWSRRTRCARSGGGC